MSERIGIQLTPITVAELAQLLHATHVNGLLDGIVTGVSTDNRQLSDGDAFVAFVGQRVDGHDFVDHAFDRGASVAIVSKPVKTNRGTTLQVSSPLLAVQQLAMRERAQFAGPVVGITGSNGKTTTKQMVSAVLGKLGHCLYTIANRNNELGLPLTILQRTPAHRSIVVEMGMRGFGQIAELSQIAKPNIGIITNIGHSHIELLGSQAGIAEAKGELLQALPADGQAILNADDPWLQQIAKKSAAQVLWYGFDATADVRALDIHWEQTGMRFDVDALGQRATMVLPTFGLHNISNALAAITTGITLGMQLSDIAEGLAGLEELSGRLRIVTGVRDTIVIDDCYNASPLSTMASLNVLSGISAGRQRAAILGDMYELGEFSEQGHRQVGEHAAQIGVQTVIAVGSQSAWTYEAAKSHGVPTVYHAETVAEALTNLPNWLPAGAAVLVKASRGMQLEQIVSALTSGTEASEEI